MYGRNVEFIDEFDYLGITLENTGGWNMQKEQ